MKAKQMNTIDTARKSRWGYHATDYATFARLRQLHAWYWQTVYDFHRWHRWWRKQPQNRRGDEPAYCPAFVEEGPWYKPVARHGVAGFKVYPQTIVDHGLVALYHQVRHPQSEPVPQLADVVLERIATLHAQTAAWFNK